MNEMQRVPRKPVDRAEQPAKQPVVVNLIQPAFPQVKHEDAEMYVPEDDDERELDRLIALFRA